MPGAANADRFYPQATDDPEFMRWAHRIALRLANLPLDAPERDVRRVVFGDGTPGPEWAEALVFMITLRK
ncbi:MAG: hypothetical protein KDE69_15625 [Burkholderiaceae bacterium]|nr:hypothetical protein [Burkholderiaceae bacterium]